jgi:hypothetical protein
MVWLKQSWTCLTSARPEFKFQCYQTEWSKSRRAQVLVSLEQRTRQRHKLQNRSRTLLKEKGREKEVGSAK